MIGQRSLLSLLLALTWTLGLSLAAHQDCLDIPTETHFQPEEVEGTWYPIEIVLHRNDSKIYGVPVTSQCPVVTISRNKRVLTMLWNATDGDVKFSFSQKGGNRQAQWQATGEQAGSKLAILAVDVDKYMIVRICSPTLHNSILLSKHSSRSPEVMAEASNKLTELVKFPSQERKPLCVNNASVLSQLSAGLILSVSVAVLLLRQ